MSTVYFLRDSAGTSHGEEPLSPPGLDPEALGCDKSGS